MEVLKSSTVLKETDGLHSVILRFPYEGGEQYVISWQKKRFQVWRSEDFERLKPKAEFLHVGRLRPLYALQLQHLVTSDLSRVGVQRPPDVYVPHGVEVLIADKGKWKLILNAFRNDPSAGAVSHNKGAHKLTFMLSDVLVRDTLKELRQRLENFPEDPGLVSLKEALFPVGVDRSLMSHIHVIEEKGVALSATTEAILPLNGRLPEGVSNDLAQFVVFGLQGRTIDDQYGGGKIVKEAKRFLAFRFVRVK